MPRSATGRTDSSARGRRRPAAGGYTLIEVLVVLVIASVLAGVAILRIGNDSASARLDTEADRLEIRLDALCERALLTGRPHGVRRTASGYDFWRLADGDWRSLPQGDRPDGHRWPDGLRAELTLRGTRVAPTTGNRPQLICTALEPFPPHEWTLRLEGDQQRITHPPGADR